MLNTASANDYAEQLRFRWMLGRDLVVRRIEKRWGKGVMEQISLDLRDEFEL